MIAAASRVRGPDLPTSQEVCLNYFFTHLSVAALGVAFQSPVSGSGGICDTGMYVATHVETFASQAVLQLWK